MDNSTQNIYNSDEDLKKRMNKLYFIYGGIVLVIIIIGTIIFLSLSHKTSTTNFPKTKQPSPTLSIPVTYSSPTPLPIPVQLTQGAQQSQADQNYSNSQNNVLQNYPWYNKLPSQPNEYFVSFDFGTKTFTAELYTNDPTSDAQWKSDITSQLQSLGIDLNKYPVIWQIDTPTPSPTSFPGGDAQ